MAVLLAVPVFGVATQAQAQAQAQESIGAQASAALPERGEFVLGLVNEGERDGFMRLGWIKTEHGMLLYDRSMMPSAQVYETLVFGLTPDLQFESVHLEFHRGLAYMNLDLDAENGRLVGQRVIQRLEGTEEQAVDIAMPEGILPRPVAFIMPLIMSEEEGTEEAFRWYGPLGNAFADVTITARPGGVIETPAGSFDTTRYEIRGGSPDNDVYVTRGAADRRVVRIDVVGQNMQFLAVPETEAEE
ncbi:hypothetical protein [Parasphingopyxis lamellibrachiae]|uniref:hypothetical protein n=1 Tax=Parasphingopyxis lamellibrachiae TaxID=680125 RepID=UPI0011C04AAB|nr:hypothetical protein [Parasphingopyxis lamellibrachiae]